jgi:hypothetical protein
MDLAKNQILISAVIYLAIVIIIYLSNISNKFTKEKQVLFYYLICIIVPIFVYLGVIIIFF